MKGSGTIRNSRYRRYGMRTMRRANHPSFLLERRLGGDLSGSSCP
jgi:hypothetical protein